MPDPVDAILAAGGGKAAHAGLATTVGGGVTTITSWFLSSEAGILVGMLGVIVGVAIQLVFKLRDDRRAQRWLDARLEALKDGRLLE